MQSTGYNAEGAAVVETDALGALRYRLEAERIEQSASDAPLLLHGIAMSLSQPDGAPWKVTADNGQLVRGAADNEALIDLTGNVQLQGRMGKAATPLSLRTASLRYDSARQVASTESEVRIQFGSYQLRALGLTADLARRRLRLQSQVNGRLVP
jgi:LPS export ABC transporter protein LptC